MIDTINTSQLRLDAAFEPGPWSIGRDGYYGDREHANHSSLETFRESPLLYWMQFVSNALPVPEPTASMLRGTWLHMALLEPDRWAASHAVLPDGIDRRTKNGKATYTCFEHENNGKHILTIEDDACIRGMLDGVAGNDLVQDWLGRGGLTEQAIRWFDPATGIPCKALLDRVCGEVILDIKTSSAPSPAEWAKNAVRFGYHRQAPHYIAGAELALGLRDIIFLHVVVGSEPPHECFAYELNSDALRLGRMQNAKTLYRLRQCLETDSWQSPLTKKLTTISLPRWAWDEDK